MAALFFGKRLAPICAIIIQKRLETGSFSLKFNVINNFPFNPRH